MHSTPFSNIEITATNQQTLRVHPDLLSPEPNFYRIHTHAVPVRVIDLNVSLVVEMFKNIAIFRPCDRITLLELFRQG